MLPDKRMKGMGIFAPFGRGSFGRAEGKSASFVRQRSDCVPRPGRAIRSPRELMSQGGRIYNFKLTIQVYYHLNFKNRFRPAKLACSHEACGFGRCSRIADRLDA